MDYLLLVVGLGLLLLTANLLVDSSVAIAKRAHISNFVIGLTIVGIGTSAPELFVSIKSALDGSGDIAMGNVLGSNISNILLILGITAVILPFDIEKTTQRRDIPILIMASLLLLLVANDATLPGIDKNELSRLDAFVFLVVFVAYMGYVVALKGRNPETALAEADEEASSRLEGKAPLLLWTIALLSLAGLVFGGNLFLDSAKSLAHAWGMSDAVIAITIVAVGTSLPELITAVVAALKKNPQLALGNVIGSCVFNILFILGIAGLVRPLEFHSIAMADYVMATVVAGMCAVVVFTFGKNRFDRVEGFVFLATYIGYTVYLIMR